MTRCVPVCPSSSMASMSVALWSAAGAVTLSCSCQGSHQPGYFVSCSPSLHLVSGFFIFALHFVGSDHEQGVCGPRVGVEVAY